MTGHTESSGLAANLRQQAKWIDEARDPDRPATSQDITIDDIDTDELRAAADHIEKLARSTEYQRLKFGPELP